MNAGKKRCGMCARLLGLDNYHRKGSGYQAYCIPCYRDYQREQKRIARRNPETKKKWTNAAHIAAGNRKKETRGERTWRRARMTQMVADLSASGMTQRQLADAIGTTQMSVWRWANGKGTPNYDSVRAVMNLWSRLEAMQEHP